MTVSINCFAVRACGPLVEQITRARFALENARQPNEMGAEAFHSNLLRPIRRIAWEARPTDRQRATPVAYNLDVPPNLLTKTNERREAGQVSALALLFYCAFLKRVSRKDAKAQRRRDFQLLMRANLR
jgi:hypothetical protein